MQEPHLPLPTHFDLMTSGISSAFIYDFIVKQACFLLWYSNSFPEWSFTYKLSSKFPRFIIYNPLLGLLQLPVHACSSAQSCLILCNPMYNSLPGSFVHGIFQARILESVAISLFRDNCLCKCLSLPLSTATKNPSRPILTPVKVGPQCSSLSYKWIWICVLCARSISWNNGASFHYCSLHLSVATKWGCIWESQLLEISLETLTLGSLEPLGTVDRLIVTLLCFYNPLIKMEFTYYKIHPFSVNSVFFHIFIELGNIIWINYKTFSSLPSAKGPYAYFSHSLVPSHPFSQPLILFVSTDLSIVNLSYTWNYIYIYIYIICD